jgi:EmrB/QacA subfamily drug resistance transporter
MTEGGVAASRPAEPHSRYVIFGASSIALLMSSIDSTIVATALHTLTREMGTSISWSTWAITAYLLGQTVAMPLAGRLSDSWGRKRMFLIFVATFTASSLLCGLAVNVYMLVAFRFIQALGGGGFMPSAMGIVSDRFGHDRDRAIGLFSSIFPFGALLGPALGGFIVGYWNWRGIFFINVPVGIALLGLLAWLLPRSRSARLPAVDPLGSGLMSGGLLGLMLGLNQLGERGLGSPLPWALLAAGAVLLALFVRRQDSSPHPVIPPALLRRSAFAIINGLNLLYGAFALGMFSYVPLYAQARYGVGPLQAGTLLTARALGMMACAVFVALLIRRIGYRPPMAAGFVVTGAGLLMLGLPPPGMPAFAWLSLGSLASGLGVGLAGPASNNAAIDLMPDQVAAISGLRGMFRQVGGIVLVSMVALLITRTGDESGLIGHAFLVLAALAVLAIPIVAWVPERRRPV